MPAPRILLMDDNVRDIGGHYLELASLLAEGAREIGYQPKLVTHDSLHARCPQAMSDSRLAGIDIDARFQVRRMENWSLGVDGPSLISRGPDGAPTGGTRWQQWGQTFRDYACLPSRRPSAMLQSWADGFVAAVESFNPGPSDRMIVNTGGDFQMLALAAAVERLDQNASVEPLTIHVVFHFAVFEKDPTERAKSFGAQVNAALDRMKPHRIRLHATTESLREQLAAAGITATAIPYPTRLRTPDIDPKSAALPTKILLAGMPRAEKGRDQIKSLLAAIETPQLRSGNFQWSMQLPKKRWQRMIPTSMHDLYHQATTGQSDAALEVLHGNLTGEDYHAWLDRAGVGLFLYDPDRYVARCSGVLLEMMIRGVPVIVPDRCWLADQVRDAGQTNPIGWIYESTDEIPSILGELHQQLKRISQNCQAHARHIQAYHSGKNTMLEMGVTDLRSSPVRAAG